MLNSNEPDSPIYTFLNNLIPPSLQEAADKVAAQVNEAMKAGTPTADHQQNQTLSVVVKQAEDAMLKKQYSLAKSLFNSAIMMIKCDSDTNTAGTDSYLVHRLAYSVYKAKEPDELSALREANKILSELDLAHTNDAETVILAGKIEKSLYFNEQGENHLANAILFFERGFFLLNNRYNGINLAFLLNLRADSNLYTQRQEKIADAVFANRIRRMVLAHCQKDWDRIMNKEMPNGVDNMPDEQRLADETQKFWILVNRAEAYFGLGEIEAHREAHEQSTRISHEPYMMETYTNQLNTLRTLLQKQADLLTPAWKEA